MILHEDFTNPPRAGWACQPCNHNCNQGRQCPAMAPSKIGSDSRDKSAQRIGMMVLLTSAAIVIAGVLWALSWLRS